MVSVTTSTMIVRFVASLRVGQVTFRSSPIVSWIYFWMRLGRLTAIAFSSFFATNDSSGAYHPLHYRTVTVKTPPMKTALTRSQAGQAGIEPTTPAFGERCSAKLSYWPIFCVSVSCASRQATHCLALDTDHSSTSSRDARCACGSANNISVVQAARDHCGGSFP